MRSHIQHNIVIKLTNQEEQLLNEALDLLKKIKIEINNYIVDYQDILEVFQEDGNPMVFYDNITK